MVDDTPRALHTALLRRHACSTLVVWYVPGLLLGVMSFMLSAAFGAVMAHVGYYTFTVGAGLASLTFCLFMYPASPHIERESLFGPSIPPIDTSPPTILSCQI